MDNETLNRAKTFYAAGWNFFDRSDTITPCILAEAGFVCIGGDIVQCHECKGLLGNWKADNIPMTEHRKHFPNCPFVRDWKQNMMSSHEGVQLALTKGHTYDLIQSVLTDNKSLLQKPAFMLVEACDKEKVQRDRAIREVEIRKAKEKMLAEAENPAERKRILQEDEDSEWKKLLAEYSLHE